MKTAVLFSGLILDHVPVEENVKTVCDAFPNADYYFGSWDIPENENKKFLDVKFKPMKHHYNCYSTAIKDSIKNIRKAKERNEEYNPTDVGFVTVKNWNRLRNNINQILIHTMMYEKYVENKDYDLVVRARYETYIEPNGIDKFDAFQKQCYEQEKPIGFETIDVRYELMPCGWNIHAQIPDVRIGSLSDWLIIHRADRFDPKKIWQMYKDKKIRYAEVAWFEVLMDPYEFCINDTCWNGYVNLRREL